jgi:excisionase family DNA binding protein
MRTIRTSLKQAPRLLTVDQAAQLLSVKPSTVRAWILRKEKLEVVRLGRSVRITEVSVLALIEQNTFTPKKGASRK